ncbi:MAG TPA: EAL domain-containing protein [Euzebya sp.]|nr:EAL domain-containing protein [Euzebya sp.]
MGDGARPTSNPAAELQGYLAMQALVTDLLTTFVQLPPERLDCGIDDALRRLGEFCGVDRSYVFAVTGERMTNTHEWCAAGVTPEIEKMQDMPVSVIPVWIGPLRSGMHVVVDDIAEMGPDQEAERAILIDQRIQSLLVMPMLSAGELVGFAGFDAVKAPRRFMPAEVSLLRSVADVITSAIVQRDSRRVAHAAQQRMAALTRSSADLIAVLDGNCRITWASASFRRFGLEPEGLLGVAWPDLVAAGHRDGCRADLANCTGSAVVEGGDLLLDTPSAARWIAVAYSDMRRDPSVGGIVVNAHDVTQRRQVEERLAHDSQHDPLTGLANRTLLANVLAGACSGPVQTQGNVAIAFVDLDHFKLVNDALGHEIGDALLVATADRLTDCIGDLGTVTRFGGDEFVVMIPDLPSWQGPEHLTGLIRSAFAEPFNLRGVSHRVTVSVGIAQAARSGRDPDTLLRDADTAMYEAKARGRNRSVSFDRSLHARIRRRADLMGRLPIAVASNRITVHHQPIVDLATGVVVGSEALARWNDLELGTVSPVEFIPVAEELGIIGALGEQVLSAALGHATTWSDHLGLSVNLSPCQLTDIGLPDRVEAFLARHGVPAHRLTLEVTESILVERPEVTRDILGRLRAGGVLVALDDFGTGYSSLSLLGDLPIDILKVDRSFIARLTESVRDRRLVRAIIGIAQDLGMEAVAEGVETAAQREMLVDLGCPRAQGWLFGRPVPAEEFLAATASPLAV